MLVEDDQMIGDAMAQTLKDDSYAVDWARDGLMALESVACHRYDLILLDLGLPGKDGLDVLKAIRAGGNTVAVIIITARDAIEERIKGLDGGADDYILKPFKMVELLARMRAVLRRQGGEEAPLLSNGIISLDPVTHEVSINQNDPIRLTAREFSLMQALLRRPGAILSRDNLEERIYGWGEEVESNAIEYLIHALRKKLGNDTIKNVRGVGWMVSK